MDLLSRWTTMANGVYYFTLPFECLSRSEGTERSAVTSLEQITLKISYNGQSTSANLKQY